jgi:hypothetical protein
MSAVPSNYYDILANIESGGNPNAQAKTSSASGLFQFTKSTWQALGLEWSQVFNPDLQRQAAQTLTSGNANVLSNAGIPVDNGSLYAAHFLGAGQAVSALQAPDGTPLSAVVSGSAIHANSFLQGMTVGDFKSWLGHVTDPLRLARARALKAKQPARQVQA